MRFSIAFALLLAVFVALTVPPALRSFAQKLERHIPSRSENSEAADRNGWGGRVKAANGFIGHRLLPVLMQVRGGSL